MAAYRFGHSWIIIQMCPRQHKSVCCHQSQLSRSKSNLIWM